MPEPHATTSTPAPPTILIVEDDPQVRTMLEETLQGEGIPTRLASHGAEGLKAFEEGGVDLVITDILMPEMEGLQFIKALREVAPSLPIIAISGGAPHLSPGCNLELASMFGATCVMMKPLDLDALLATIQKHLSSPS